MFEQISALLLRPGAERTSKTLAFVAVNFCKLADTQVSRVIHVRCDHF